MLIIEEDRLSAKLSSFFVPFIKNLLNSMTLRFIFYVVNPPLNQTMYNLLTIFMTYSFNSINILFLANFFLAHLRLNLSYMVLENNLSRKIKTMCVDSRGVTVLILCKKNYSSL